MIVQEFTPTHSLQLNGVAERNLGIIEVLAPVARIQPEVLFEHVQMPKADALWAEFMYWLNGALNHTEFTANSGNKSINDI